MGDLVSLLLVFFLVIMNGFFVAAEFAMVKVRNSRIETLVSEGNARATYVQKIVNNLDSYLSACQLGITLASLGLGWVGEPAIAHLIKPILLFFGFQLGITYSISGIIAFIIITALHIILGELAPKSLSIQSAEKVIMFTCIPLTMFYKIMYPIIWLFNKSASLILKSFGINQASEHESAHTDEEIRILVEESYEHGLIDQTELTFVDNIFNFSEKLVREIMVPRTEMICFYKDDSFDEIINIAMSEQLTRYPICGEDKDEILGYIHIKDLFKQKVDENEFNIDNIIRKNLSVPETMSISILLKIFQKEKEQMAIVIDEYGGTSGLVTVEDILEEIVGEIQDEFDEEGAPVKALDDNSYSVDGKVAIEEINDLLNLNIDSQYYDTIGGWFYSKMESSNPLEINQKVQYNNYEFIVTELDNLRIVKLLIRPINFGNNDIVE